MSTQLDTCDSNQLFSCHFSTVSTEGGATWIRPWNAECKRQILEQAWWRCFVTGSCFLTFRHPDHHVPLCWHTSGNSGCLPSWFPTAPWQKTPWNNSFGHGGSHERRFLRDGMHPDPMKSSSLLVLGCMRRFPELTGSGGGEGLCFHFVGCRNAKSPRKVCTIALCNSIFFMWLPWVFCWHASLFYSGAYQFAQVKWRLSTRFKSRLVCVEDSKASFWFQASFPLKTLGSLLVLSSRSAYQVISSLTS